MRVLFLNSRLTTRGGAHRWMLSVLARLQGQAQTLCAVGSVDPTFPPHEAARIGPYERVKGLDRSGLSGRGGQGARDRLAALLDRWQPDVIQVNDVMDPELLRMVSPTGRGVMMVQDHRLFCPGRGKVDAAGAPCDVPMGDGCARCFDEQAYADKMDILTRCRQIGAGDMARLLVLSNYMKAELEAADIPIRPVTVIPPFVDIPARRRREDPGDYHLLAGRLSEHKGVTEALQAARTLDLPLVVAGSGPLEQEVMRAARNHPDRVRHAGWLEHAELMDLMSGARSLWMPGIWAEPFGIVGLEAQHLGVPVIASHTGGVTDWLDHEVTGLLVPPGDVRALGQAASRLEQDAALARRLGDAARAHASRDFAPEPIMARLIGVYRDIIQETDHE